MLYQGVQMKKKFSTVLIVALAALMLFVSCQDKTVYHDVILKDGETVIKQEHVAENETYTLPEAPEKEGYSFQGWKNGGGQDTLKAGDTVTVTADMTFDAVWDANKYKITYIANNGTDEKKEKEFAFGGDVIIPSSDDADIAFTYSKHLFNSWNTAADGSGTKYSAEAKYTAAADLTLYAVWDDAYQITINLNDGQGDSSYTGVVGTSPSALKTPVKKGYTFKGWKISGTDTAFSTETALSEDVSIEAVWEANKYKITYIANDNTESKKETEWVFDGAGYKILPVDDSSIGFTYLDHAFDSWNTKEDGTGTSYKADDTYTEDADLTLYAVWKNIYTITIALDGGSLTPEVTTLSIVEGSVVPEASRPATPTKDGCRFDGWVRDDKTKFDFAKDTVSSDITLTATWVEVFTVTFNSDGGSDVEAETVDKDSKAEKPADPTRTGYRFDGWYNGDTAFDFDNEIITEAVALKAKWVEQVTVTFVTGGAKAISAKTMDKGNKLELDSDPVNVGGVFNGWYNLTDSATFTSDAAVTKNITLVAQWTYDKTYAIGDDGPATSGGVIAYDVDADNASGNADGLISQTCGYRYLEASTTKVQLNSRYYTYYYAWGSASGLAASHGKANENWRLPSLEEAKKCFGVSSVSSKIQVYTDQFWTTTKATKGYMVYATNGSHFDEAANYMKGIQFVRYF